MNSKFFKLLFYIFFILSFNNNLLFYFLIKRHCRIHMKHEKRILNYDSPCLCFWLYNKKIWLIFTFSVLKEFKNTVLNTIYLTIFF